VADTLEVFEKFESHYEYVDLGERVLAWGHIHVRARGSGIETDIEVGGVYEFRDGKVVRWEDFGSKDKALEAVGPSE
jgi:limonene-1,2-epoxide hydrolase